MNCFDLNLQISMSVKWNIHATPMLTALIPMAVSTAHVWLGLKAMDSTVQVRGATYCLCFLRGNYTFVIYHLAADIPECVRELDDCDMNATCINTVGSYDCLCNTGFTGNGFTCTGEQ